MKNHIINKFCHLVDSNDREKEESFTIEKVALIKRCSLPDEVSLNLTVNVNLRFDKEVKVIHRTFEVYDGIISISPSDPNFSIDNDDLNNYSTFTFVGKFVVNNTRRKLTNREILCFDSDFEESSLSDPYFNSGGVLSLRYSRIEFYYSDSYCNYYAIRYISNKD